MSQVEHTNLHAHLSWLSNCAPIERSWLFCSTSAGKLCMGAAVTTADCDETATVFHSQLDFAQPAVLTTLQLLALQHCAQIVCLRPRYACLSPVAQASTG